LSADFDSKTQFENRLTFGEIIRCTKVVPFYGPPCTFN